MMEWEDSGSSVEGGGSNNSSGKCTEGTQLHEAVFHELIGECKHSAPGARLSARLRTALERMCPTERRSVVCRAQDGCAPLFIACKRGNVELVEYLVHVCDAELEQRGVYEVADDRSVHTVTPLWCAAVEGRLEVLRVLVDAGAAVDACSDSGSTPVRSACFMTHLDVVRFLVSRGADIHRPNHNGGTCLINSVQSVRLCTFLLEQGAAVDAVDMQQKTALHYAIQEHRLETARLLLEHGANPHLRSRAGDDALRTACLKGAAHILHVLHARLRYPAARLADAFELLGATQLDEFNDVGAALVAWRRATAIRHAAGAYIDKTPAWTPHPALGDAREWRTQAELEAASTDMDAMRTQALLVAARILGPEHKDTVLRLMYRGASYGDAFRYQRCIELWTWALEIRLSKDSLIYSDSCHTACALTRLMLDAHAGRLDRARGLPQYEHAWRVFTLLARSLPGCRPAIEVRPVFRKHAETYDRALRCVTHLLHLLLALQRTPQQRAQLEHELRALLAAAPRSAHTGDTLLHLCVSSLNVIRSTYFADEADVPRVFPSASVVRLLLSCGARACVRNEARSTALHVASIPYNFSSALVLALLDAGAHIDQPNKFGDLPCDLVALNRDSRVPVLRYVTLRCLAARALLAAAPGPALAAAAAALPATLRDFLDLHRP